MYYYSLQIKNGIKKKKSLFTVRTIRNTQIQSVPHRKHIISLNFYFNIISPLQSPTG
jgi:hypothetical protein